MSTGYHPDKKFWVPMGAGPALLGTGQIRFFGTWYRPNFQRCRPLALLITFNLMIQFVRMELKPSFEYEKDLKTTLGRPVTDRPPTFIESQFIFENYKFIYSSFLFYLKISKLLYSFISLKNLASVIYVSEIYECSH